MRKPLILLCAMLLTVPIKAEYTSDDIVDIMHHNQIHFVNFLFTDLLGNVKEVTVPEAHVPDALAHGLSFDGSSALGCTHNKRTRNRGI